MHLATDEHNLLIKALMNLIAKCNSSIDSLVSTDLPNLALLLGYHVIKEKVKECLGEEIHIDRHYVTYVRALKQLKQDEPTTSEAISKLLHKIQDQKASVNLN